jgi:uncharacterized protein
MAALRSPSRHVYEPRPAASYVSSAANGLAVDEAIYAPIATDVDSRQLVESFVIPVRDGRAWTVPAGYVCRFNVIEGPQVLDLNIWGAQDTRERFWASRTRQFHGTHVTVGDRLWSTLPFLRPLATIVADTIAYGFDDDGAGCNDLLGTRCDPYVTELLSHAGYDYHCHSNLSRAIQSYGLSEFDVHDVLNLFQVTGLTGPEGRYYMKASPGQVGDFVEIFAETDLICAASTCPGGDLAVPLWGPGSGLEPNCNPIQIEVFKLDERLLTGWSPSEPSHRPWVETESASVELTYPRPPLSAAVPSGTASAS